MKLGLCYMVFDGEELLEFAARSIRHQIDHISVTYQDISYFGNKANPDLLDKLKAFQHIGLIDEILFYETDLNLEPKLNELNLRNLGRQASKRAGCTHHISADVDEFYKPEQLAYAKEVMSKDDYDFSTVQLYTYYKKPTYLVTPVQTLRVSLIHPVDNEYARIKQFPFLFEMTRRLARYEKYRVFTPDEFVIHHMSYVRKDIRKKFQNSDNARFYEIEKFCIQHDNYVLGERLRLLPDYKNRKTKEIENYFNIDFW